MTKKVRLGIVGLGVQGSVYAGLISDGMVPNLELGAICDGRPATRQLVESKYSAAAFYDDYLRMLDSGTVDAVVICVPSYLHPEMGIDALQHGVHVLLEKPAGIYTKQVEALNLIAATKPELTFAIMFNQRNNPLYRRIKEIVSSGAIGENPAHQLDHHHLVAASGLLRPGCVAGYLRRRRRRSACQPGAAPVGPVAVDLRIAPVGICQGGVRFPTRDSG
jgi:predicted dehydrogenase